MSQSLEPTIEEVRQMLALTTEKITTFLDNIDKPTSYSPLQSTEDAYNNPTELPETATRLKDILDDLFDNRVANALATSHPGFMAYIPGGGLFHSALAELIAKVTNRYVGIDVTAPFLSQIESDVLRWFADWVGFPKTAGGSLTSGGSIANLTAVICARSTILGEHFTKGTVYASGFVHHSMWKAFHAAGIASSQIRNIPVDDNHKMELKALNKALEEDKKNGLTPLMIVANAGSTNTGSIDPLVEIASLAKEYGAWYHIDAAYGGFFAMTQSGKQRLKGLELADSMTLDPHKGLFLPYGTGAFIVRDREILKSVFTHKADYIPDKTSDEALWDFSEMSLELTRPFRGLAVWLPFKMLGADVFRNALDEKLELANYFYEQIKKTGRWKIIASPELSLTVFRYDDPQVSPELLNQINRKIINHVNNQGRVNL
jgi:aromatic-L-amino-acid decarboxylase